MSFLKGNKKIIRVNEWNSTELKCNLVNPSNALLSWATFIMEHFVAFLFIQKSENLWISAQFIIQNSKLGTIYSCRPHGMERGWGLEICWVFVDSIVFKRSIFHFFEGVRCGVTKLFFFCGSHKRMTRYTKNLPKFF